tara:strand:- start:1041 stop:1586 length:546 start_codon:yes stop_codon:yes gene_type:complete
MNKFDWVHNQLQMNHGSFHTTMLEAWLRASPDNKARLEKSFSEFFSFGMKNRHQMMTWLIEDMKLLHVQPNEYFEGYELNSSNITKTHADGIWMSAEYDDDPYFMTVELSYGQDKLKIFDYYQYGDCKNCGNSPYDGGVLMKFKELLTKYGWYLSWNDPGTIVLYPLYENTLDHKLSPEDY